MFLFKHKSYKKAIPFCHFAKEKHAECVLGWPPPDKSGATTNQATISAKPEETFEAKQPRLPTRRHRCRVTAREQWR